MKHDDWKPRESNEPLLNDQKPPPSSPLDFSHPRHKKKQWPEEKFQRDNNESTSKRVQE